MKNHLNVMSNALESESQQNGSLIVCILKPSKNVERSIIVMIGTTSRYLCSAAAAGGPSWVCDRLRSVASVAKGRAWQSSDTTCREKTSGVRCCATARFFLKLIAKMALSGDGLTGLTARLGSNYPGGRSGRATLLGCYS